MTPASAFSLDTRAGAQTVPMMETFAQKWHDVIGHDQELPAIATPRHRQMRGSVTVGKIADVTLVDARVATPIRTYGLPSHHDREVRLYAVHHGVLTLDDPNGQGTHQLKAGEFMLQHVVRAVHFDASADLELQIVSLPAPPLTPLLNGRLLAGLTTDAPMRLLLAHARAIQGALADLSPTGIWPVRDSLFELARAVVRDRLDDQAPAIGPALVATARALADARLTDPGLNPSVIARECHVSLRTLQRAFAETGESLRTFIHRRRVEEAGRTLVSCPGASTAEVAARWQFTDSSHLSRSIRKQFGTTPRELSSPGRTGSPPGRPGRQPASASCAGARKAGPNR
ncbi:helix-turn-helix domain-containing protein [Kineosporia succinea]